MPHGTSRPPGNAERPRRGSASGTRSPVPPPPPGRSPADCSYSTSTGRRASTSTSRSPSSAWPPACWCYGRPIPHRPRADGPPQEHTAGGAEPARTRSPRADGRRPGQHDHRQHPRHHRASRQQAHRQHLPQAGPAAERQRPPAGPRRACRCHRWRRHRVVVTPPMGYSTWPFLGQAQIAAPSRASGERGWELGCSGHSGQVAERPAAASSSTSHS
jgi:hypothetical protein